MESGYGGWDNWLPLVQISLNQTIKSRTGSAAFDLMFNRPFNGLSNFRDVNTMEDLDNVIVKSKEQWQLF